MWNKAPQKAGKQTDQDFIAEKPAIASSSEVLGNHHGAKRQRRPSVRLEDIGDRPAAIVAEKKRKRMAFFASSLDAYPDKSTPSLEADVPLEDLSKGLKIRPLVHVNNGNNHEHASSHDGSDGERQTVRHTKLTSPSSSGLIKSWQQQEPHTVVHDASEGPTPSQFLKLVSKKGRNGTRKRGRPIVAASVKQLASARPSAFAERVPHITDPRDVHSEEDTDAHTPEGFRDCDLETSDYFNEADFNDAKDLTISQGSKPSRNGEVFPLRDEQECESREAFEDGSSRQVHDHAERNKDLPASQQIIEKGSPKIDEEFVKRNTEGGISISNPNETTARKHAYVVDPQILTEADRLPHANKVKCNLDANGRRESKEPTSNNADLHFARHHPPLRNGVRGWLQNLGLGKYAQKFEAHEVDIEVLPLLTLDDLKEMGINAVGSRRKLFFAIQQLGKCSLVKAD